MMLSWVAFAFAIVSTLPQLYETLTKGQLRDYHPWTPILAMVGTFSSHCMDIIGRITV
jgi:hypothetical protein